MAKPISSGADVIKPEFSLRYCFPCGGEIIRESDGKSVAFLQGDDYVQLEAQEESVWKMVKNKKMGTKRAIQALDSIFSEYVEV